MPPFMKLIALNRKRGEFRADVQGDAATIYLYDFIVNSDDEAEWFGGVSPEAFTKALRAMTAPVIHLRVNSPGGSVFAARAIEQAMREHNSQIIAHIDGVAASAAGFAVMGADEIEIAPGGMFMVHQASTFAFGNADDLMAAAGVLEQIDVSQVETFAQRTGQSADDLRKWVAAETWFDAKRAVELGFADRIAGGNPEKVAATAAARWDLSAYTHAPVVQTSASVPAALSSTPDETDREALHRAVLRKLIPA